MALSLIVLSVVAKAGRAIIKTTIKSGFALYEKGKDTAAEAELVTEKQLE